MPKYLTRASYTVEGLKGLFKDGGTKRRKALERLAESLGGKLEACYFAFGDDDLFAIWDFPDNVNVAAAALMVNASGVAKSKVTVLLTPEEIDRAVKTSVNYSPPGQ